MEKAKLLGQPSVTAKDWGWEEGTGYKGYKGISGGMMKIFYILTVMVITKLDTFVNTQLCT